MDFALSRVNGALGWVLGGVPRWLILPGFARRWSRVIYIDDPKDLRLGLHKVRRGDRIDVLLNPTVLLRKSMEVPSKARSSLSQVVDLTIRQTMPQQAGGLVWRHRVAGRTKGQLKVEVFLLKSTTLSQLDEEIEGLGATLRTVGIAGHAASGLLYDARRRTDRMARFWAWIAGGLALMILAWMLVQWTVEKRALDRQETALRTELAAVHQQIVEAQTRLEAQDAEVTDRRLQIEAFADDYHRLGLLLDLTEVLPDDVWISDLSVSGAQLRFSGFASGEVSAVVEAIRQLDWALDVDLDGPVFFDTRDRRNRFEMLVSLTVVKGAADL